MKISPYILNLGCRHCLPRGLGARSPQDLIHRSHYALLSILCALFALGAARLDAATFDVAVVGAGTGGMAAAIQAAREGMSVAVIEPTDRIGGQMTAAGVCTMDDVGRTRHGIYLDFITRVRERYARTGTSTNICLWGGDTIAVEPREAEIILLDMLREASGERGAIFTRASLLSADVSDGAKRALLISQPESGELVIEAKVFIDATEHGDLLPLAGAEYRVGASRPGELDPSANVQDITYVAVVRRYPDGMPDELLLKSDPPRYESFLPKFRALIARDGARWPGSAPFDVPTHNAYRALPNEDGPRQIDGGDPASWELITRTCINWANDWPGRGHGEPGLSVLYTEDRDYRAATEREAMNETLCFIRYMQTELGMNDWSVDIDQGYGGYFTNGWQGASDPLLPDEFAPVLRHFPPSPYVREGRRIVGVETLIAPGIKRDPARGRTALDRPTSIALGEYPIDIHGSRLPQYAESYLGETPDLIPTGWNGREGVFSVPFEVLIPSRVDGLIAAEKNVSVSRAVNGAVRLHPITMHIGQAAGAIAAESVRSGVQPRSADVRAVQDVLLAAGCRLAQDICDDVEPTDSWWSAAQRASFIGAFERYKMTKSIFGANMPITRRELQRLADAEHLGAVFSGEDLFITNAEFMQIISRTFGAASAPFASCVPRGEGSFALKRGAACEVICGLAAALADDNGGGS